MHELARLLALLHVGTLTSFEALVFSRGAVVQPREEQARVGFFFVLGGNCGVSFPPLQTKTFGRTDDWKGRAKGLLGFSLEPKSSLSRAA